MGAKRENLGSVLEWKMRETEKGDLGMGGWGEGEPTSTWVVYKGSPIKRNRFALGTQRQNRVDQEEI